MSSLPTGTVTFLFTDIEGSTRLARRNAAAWEATRERHHAILHAAVGAQGGYVFQVIGDAFCAAFANVHDATHAALNAQRNLHAEAWNDTPVRVRMAIHTGAAEAHAGQYRGYLTLTHVQRILSLAHGGQVLLSQTTAQLLQEDAASRDEAPLPLSDLGEVRLKDFPSAEHLYQLIVPGLPSDFPPLSAANTTPNNLPEQLTSFIGRERELAELHRLLSTTRLLTLTGSGGVGKTRLSLQLAQVELSDYPDGAWLVELAPLADPALIPQTVAALLGLREQPGLPLLAMLREYLRARTLLLVIDNCEHLIADVAALVDTLLHAAPKLRIVASSREALGVAGEQAWRLPSLEIPAGADSPQPSAVSVVRPRLGGAVRQAQDATQPSAGGNPLSDLLSYAAVRLFAERAAQANAAFRMNEANAPAVVQICRRLDGIPLAIELAAARVKAMRVEQIAERLNDRFRLLTGGSRTALPRQQTLRGTIDWSYSLLSEPERVLLRRLSVFAGGWTLEAAEAVCGDNDGRPTTDERRATTLDAEGQHLSSVVYRLSSEDVLDLLTHLVDKSLVVLDEQAEEPRYRMLETVRQYAREKLLESIDGDSMRTRHLEHYRQMAQAAEPRMRGREMGKQLMNRLDADLDNIRAALNWAKTPALAEEGLQLANALFWFWNLRGHQAEGLDWLQSLLARCGPDMDGELHLKALDNIGAIMSRQGDADGTSRTGEQLQALAVRLGSPEGTVRAYALLGQAARLRGELKRAEEYLQRAIDTWVQPQNMDVYRGLRTGLADVRFAQGRYADAARDFGRLLREVEPLGNPNFTSYQSRRLGQALIYLADFPDARARFRASLEGNSEVGDTQGIAACIAAFAALAAAEGKPLVSARLFGASEALCESIQTRLLPNDHTEFEKNVANLRVALDPAAFDAAWAEGHALTLEQAVALAQQPTGAEQALPSQTPALTMPADDAGLTARELEVLRLLAEGLSNQQIAKRLVVSTFNVRAHLRAIYGKLNVGTRTAAVRAAREHGIM